ncbi:MAG TPA: ABC-2 family transporter protein [Phycisphaerae bacterium]|nr:ABC-2 family transporter protein [Phycisphaerae bacterium]
MTTIVRAFPAFLRVYIGVMLQYRGEIILWAIWGLVNPAVLYAMWSAAAEGRPDGQIAGFSKGQLAAYYFAIMVIGHVTTAWDTYEMGYRIRSGELSAKLLRPILPIWESMANNLAYKIATLGFLAPMWAICFWLYAPDFRAPPWQITVGIFTIVLAGALNFVLGYVVSLIAFWTPKLDAVGEVYFGLSMFLGGRFSPMLALPGAVLSFAWALPFRWMFAFPAEVLTGKMTDTGQIATGLAMQLVWLAGLVILFRVGWAAAVKRYSAVSG